MIKQFTNIESYFITTNKFPLLSSLRLPPFGQIMQHIPKIKGGGDYWIVDYNI